MFILCWWNYVLIIHGSQEVFTPQNPKDFSLDYKELELDKAAQEQEFDTLLRSELFSQCGVRLFSPPNPVKNWTLSPGG